jgi:hypothetical protein
MSNSQRKQASRTQISVTQDGENKATVLKTVQEKTPRSNTQPFYKNLADPNQQMTIQEDFIMPQTELPTKLVKN